MTAISPAEVERYARDWHLMPFGYGERFGKAIRWRAEALHELISLALVETVFSTGSRRLIINTAPRHGKTEQVGHYGTTWYLDWFPHLRVALAMYAAELAGEVGAKVRDTIRENPHDLSVRVRRDSSARNRWNTTKGGGFVATGVGGILTGRGGSLLLCDDPVKNAEEATSQVYRQKTWDWYLSTFRTRLEPGPDDGDGAIALVMTRWHEDDLTGRLIHEQGTVEDGGIWNHLVIPAIAESTDDPLGRAPGEALSARYPIESLERTRDELGPYVWNALYQQRPSPPAGTIFQRAWWKFYDAWPRYQAEQFLGSIDCTFKDLEDSDFVVIQVWCRVGADKYLLDEWRQQADFLTTCAALVAMSERWPQCQEWIVEATANGPAILASLANRIVGLNGFNPRDSKEARAMACQPTVAAGQVWLPNVKSFPKLLPTDRHEASPADFIDEAAAFPNGMHDDQVDAFTQAMLHMGVASPILLSQTWRDDRLSGRGR